MTNTCQYRLCGGTFFTLLSDARLPMPSKNQFYNGQRSGITEPELLLALAKVSQPDIRPWMSSEEKTVKDNTRDFKACINWGGGFFRFNDASVRKSFDTSVRENYVVPLTEMTALTRRFLDINSSTKKDEYLVKALVEVMDADKTILDEQEFFVCRDGSSMTKAEILAADKFCFEAFLLGIWHYVLTVITDNKIGAETYDDWCPKQGGGRRDYTKAIGESSSREICLEYYEPIDEPQFESTDGNETHEEATDTVEAEIVDEIPSSEQKVQQTVNNPFVFNFTQNGNNNTQIGHIEHYHAGKE